MRLRKFTFACLALAAFVGCEKNKAPEAPPSLFKQPGALAPAANPETVKNDLKEIGMMALLSLDKKNAPPTSLKDLEPFAADFPGGIAGLKDGRYLIRYGLKMPADAAKILACEKDAPERGGWAVLLSGEVKKLTKEEMATAWK